MIEQRLGTLQIRGIEALGEPAVNGREQLARLGPPASFTPQLGDARRGAEFIGFCLLPSSDAQRLLKGDLALFEPVEADERDAFEAMKIRLQLSVSGFFQDLQPIPRGHESRAVLILPR
jgi:hypothetical protein